MKNSFLSQWARNNIQTLTLVSLLLISSTSIYLSGQSRLVTPAQIGVSVLGLGQEILTNIYSGITGFLGSVQEISDLRAKYQELQSQFQEYQGFERQFAELRAENQRLREQLKFMESQTSTLIPAIIIAKDPSNITKTIIINRGHLHGIRKNDAIIAYQGKDYGLVGRVIEVGFTSSQVQTVLDPGNFVAARFQKSRYEGLIVGLGAGKEMMRMLYIRKQAKDDFQEGDLIITSGNNSLYPRGIPLGRVQHITDKMYETNLEIDVTPVVDFSRLEYVFVVQEREG